MKHQPLNICPFVMCNLIQACQAGAFDGWRHAWRLDEREKVEKEGDRSSWPSEFWVWQQHRTVAVRRRVCTIQRSIHFLYIHQSSHHLYPFIPRGPSWLECLHSSEWEKAKVSFLYIYFAKLILLAFPPRRVRHRHNIRDPPPPQWADSLWTCLMRNGTPILFAGDLKNVSAAASSSSEDSTAVNNTLQNLQINRQISQFKHLI